MYFINPYNLIWEVRKQTHEGKKPLDGQTIINMIKNQKTWESIETDVNKETTTIALKQDLWSED